MELIQDMKFYISHVTANTDTFEDIDEKADNSMEGQRLLSHLKISPNN